MGLKALSETLERPVSPAVAAPRRAQAAIARAREDVQEAARWAQVERATSGAGWRVVERPASPHAAVEGRARRIWHDAHRGLREWPAGWMVKWGELTNAIGLTVYGERLILLDEPWFRGRRDQDLEQTIHHELCHVMTLDTYLTGAEDMHGPRFSETLRRLTAAVLPEESERETMSSVPMPKSTTGGAVSFEQAAARAMAPPITPRPPDEAAEAVARMARRLHARRDAQLRAEQAVAKRRYAEAVRRYAEASETTLAWMRRYLAGWAGSPHTTVAECTGLMLALAFPHGPSLEAECARRARFAG